MLPTHIHTSHHSWNHTRRLAKRIHGIDAAIFSGTPLRRIHRHIPPPGGTLHCKHRIYRPGNLLILGSGIRVRCFVRGRHGERSRCRSHRSRCMESRSCRWSRWKTLRRQRVPVCLRRQDRHCVSLNGQTGLTDLLGNYPPTSWTGTEDLDLVPLTDFSEYLIYDGTLSLFIFLPDSTLIDRSHRLTHLQPIIYSTVIIQRTHTQTHANAPCTKHTPWHLALATIHSNFTDQNRHTIC